MFCRHLRLGRAYDLGDGGILQAAGDGDGLDQELVLALGIWSGLFFHSLQQHYCGKLAFVSWSEPKYQTNLELQQTRPARCDPSWGAHSN